ncbi:MAG: alpha-ketoglutaric semialdehyde dehydrogenase [Actinomycetota bacterium]|nr:alpha-ketoglutaric semialdehyde dehydrogenase [Actinomycetota bacterium]
MGRDFGNFINGEWVDAASKDTFESLNPADRTQVLGNFARGGPADVDRAVQAAVDAYPGWMQTPAPERADYLLRVALLLEERKEDLSRVMTQEMGKTLKESRADVQEGIDFAHYMAGEGRRLMGQTIPAELPNKIYMTLRHPVGVVGLITPWNFPIAIPLWKIAPALVAGCTSIFKPAEDTPLCAALLVDMFREVGLPPGVLNLVNGFGEETGAPLVDHPDVRAISFTGSLDVGRSINEKCGRMMKRCSLELGSKNALIVMPDANLELAVEASAWGAFATSGQRCTATSRLIVHDDVRAEFTDRLLDRVGSMKVGNGLEEDVELAPVINEQQKDRVLEYISIGQQEGAKLLTGGEELTGGDYANGYFIAPTVFDNMTPEMRIAKEEIFGPVTGILPIESVEEAIAVANGTEYGLSCAIYTHDITNTFKAVQQLEFGVVYVNAPTIGAEIQVPFGGMKHTGNGHREAGPPSLDEFTEWKTVGIDFSGKLQRAQMKES